MNKSKKITCPLELLFKLKNLYYYNEVDGVFTRKIDSGKTAKAGSILSNKASNGYLVLFIDGHPYQSSRLAWLYNYGEMPIKKIKYRDNNIYNIAITNLYQNELSKTFNNDADLLEDMSKYISYCSNTGQFTWIKSKGISKTIVGEIAGTKIVKNYISIVFNQKSYLAHRLAWLYVHGEFPKNLIDHIDKDKTNNRIDNLREATHAENMQNIGTFSKNNTCNALGVSKKRKKFSASICINRKKISLGSFNTIELAHEAYLTAKRKYHSFCTI